MQNKPNFPDAQMNVTSFGKRDYDDLAAFKLWENKPNSKPNKPNLHRGLNQRELLCRKRVMEMILKTAKFRIIMMLPLPMALTGRPYSKFPRLLYSSGACTASQPVKAEPHRSISMDGTVAAKPNGLSKQGLCSKCTFGRIN
jgi:hypothetical protein